MPRPLKLDDQKKQRVIHLVMHGSTVAGAAREVGCSVRTVEREADRDEPFGWRLDVARDSRDAAGQSQEEVDEADAVTVDLLFEGFCTSLTDELALLWPSEPHASGQAVPSSNGSAISQSAGRSCERCDKTVTSAPPTA